MDPTFRRNNNNNNYNYNYNNNNINNNPINTNNNPINTNTSNNTTTHHKKKETNWMNFSSIVRSIPSSNVSNHQKTFYYIVLLVIVIVVICQLELQPYLLNKNPSSFSQLSDKVHLPSPPIFQDSQRKIIEVKQKLALQWQDNQEDPFDHAFDAIPEHISSGMDIVSVVQETQLPIIFFITPTYQRSSQMVDLIRLSQTLMHDNAIYWIVIEDAEHCTKRVRHILQRTGLLFAHVATRTPMEIKGRPNTPKGVNQRNRALDIIDQLGMEGIVYFGDDDNAYDIRLFPELRKTKKVGVFSVGFVGGGAYERCIVDEQTGKFWYFLTNWVGGREYSMDMGGFAFHTSALQYHPRFRNDWPMGFLETKFVEQIITTADQLEPLMDNCTRIYVWHVSTKGATLANVQSDPLFYKYVTLV